MPSLNPELGLHPQKVRKKVRWLTSSLNCGKTACCAPFVGETKGSFRDAGMGANSRTRGGTAELGSGSVDGGWIRVI